jgi:hypothetical protein
MKEKPALFAMGAGFILSTPVSLAGKLMCIFRRA